MGNKFIFLFLTVFFILGTIFGKICDYQNISIYKILYIFAIYLILFFLRQFSIVKIINTIIAFFIFFVFGVFVQKQNSNYSEDYINKIIDEDIDEYFVMSLSTNLLHCGWNKNEFLLLGFKKKNKVVNVNFYCKVQMFFFGNKSIKKIKYGDVFKIKGNLKKIKTKNNEFIYYKKYLNDNYIFFQDFVYPKDIFFIKNIPDNNIVCFLKNLHFNLKQGLIKFVDDVHVKGILSAIILGDKKELDKDIKNIYIKSGVGHMLAVSGLHIGFLFFFINMFLSLFLYINRILKIIKIIIIIILLWFYTFLIECPYSALRATSMITLLLFCKMLRKQYNPILIICISIFFLMIFCPEILYSVSGQLSYSSVCAIIFLSQFLYKKVKTKYSFINYFLLSIIISLSTQLATLPINIYYFKQINVYSVLSNLIIVPLGPIIFGGGIAVIALNFCCCEWLSQTISFFLSLLIVNVNVFLEVVSKMPGNVIYF